jgi:hypothetical protein
VTPEQIVDAERLLLDGADLDAVAETLGLNKRTLERAWREHHDDPPVRWARRQGAREPAGASPLVSFRLPEWDDLARIAAEDGAEPNAWARDAVRRSLARRTREK